MTIKEERKIALKGLNLMYSLWKGMQSDKPVKFIEKGDMSFVASYCSVNKSTIPVLEYTWSKGYVDIKKIKDPTHVLIKLTQKGYNFVDKLA